VPIPWRQVAPAAAIACGASGAGAWTVSRLAPELIRPPAFGLLVAVALYTFANKNLGATHAPKLTRAGAVGWGVLVGGVIGFYDGFFGPGTGSFLMFAYVGLFGFDFLRATACAKVINLATNIAAVSYFAATGSIHYRYAIPMAACNVLGAMVGTRLAILRGNAFVRRLFLAVILLVLARFGWQIAATR
jgi:uncharacterized membrane protein YfcA